MTLITVSLADDYETLSALTIAEFAAGLSLSIIMQGKRHG